MKIKRKSTYFFLFSALLILNIQAEKKSCPSGEDYALVMKQSDDEYYRKICSEKDEIATMSCKNLDPETRNSVCGEKGPRQVYNSFGKTQKIMLCSCDDLCGFHGDCCPDLSDVCPQNARMRDKYAKVTLDSIDKDIRSTGHLKHPVGSPDIQCISEGFSVVTSCPRDDSIKKAIR